MQVYSELQRDLTWCIPHLMLFLLHFPMKRLATLWRSEASPLFSVRCSLPFCYRVLGHRQRASPGRGVLPGRGWGRASSTAYPFPALRRPASILGPLRRCFFPWFLIAFLKLYRWQFPGFSLGDMTDAFTRRRGGPFGSFEAVKAVWLDALSQCIQNQTTDSGPVEK